MPEGRYREEVFNVVLAQLLHDRGVVSAPEQIVREAGRGRRAMPDVLVTFQGLTTAIEGKTDDVANATAEVEGNARSRVERGIAHLAIAVLYPSELRNLDWGDLKSRLSTSVIKMAVFSEGGGSGWASGDVDRLIALLRRSYQQLVEEDVLQRAVAVLNEAVDSFARAVLRAPGNVERAALALGISSVNGSEEEPDEDASER